MTPHKAIEVLKELKPGDRWEIEMEMVSCPTYGVMEDWVITWISFTTIERQSWEGSTLDEAMERVLEGLKVPKTVHHPRMDGYHSRIWTTSNGDDMPH